MTKEHDQDVFALVRKNLPMIVVFCGLIAGAVRVEMTDAAYHQRIKALEVMLDTKAFTEHAIWKTNIQRDVAELQKLLSAENVRNWDKWRESIDWKIKEIYNKLNQGQNQ